MSIFILDADDDTSLLLPPLYAFLRYVANVQRPSLTAILAFQANK